MTELSVCSRGGRMSEYGTPLILSQWIKAPPRPEWWRFRARRRYRRATFFAVQDGEMKGYSLGIRALEGEK